MKETKIDKEILLFLAILLNMLFVAVVIGVITNFYKSSANWTGILVEFHGAIIEILVISIIASIFIKNHQIKEWNKTKIFIANRLIGIINLYFENIIDTLKVPRHRTYYRFGNLWIESLYDWQLLDEFDIHKNITESFKLHTLETEIFPDSLSHILSSLCKIIDKTIDELQNIIMLFPDKITTEIWELIMESDHKLRVFSFVTRQRLINKNCDFSNLCIIAGSACHPIIKLAKCLTEQPTHKTDESGYLNEIMQSIKK